MNHRRALVGYLVVAFVVALVVIGMFFTAEAQWIGELVVEMVRDLRYEPRPGDAFEFNNFLISEQGTLFVCGKVYRAGAGQRLFIGYFRLADLEPRRPELDLDASEPPIEVVFHKSLGGPCRPWDKGLAKRLPEETGWKMATERVGRAPRLWADEVERGEVPSSPEGEGRVWEVVDATESTTRRRYLFVGPAAPGEGLRTVTLTSEGGFLARLWD